MTRRRPFAQVDVFAEAPLTGNPLAVIGEAGTLDDATMQALAHWTNLSETVFLLPPDTPGADYTLRIFTPRQELPFAGHPTLGAAHAWLAWGGAPRDGATIVQSCGAGLVPIRREGEQLFFRAPPLLREGPLPPETTATLLTGLGLTPADVAAAVWADNGPGWALLMLHDHRRMMDITPDYAALAGHRVGLVAETGLASPRLELRAFTAGGYEDPVTGSLQAGVAQWLRGAGLADGNWTAKQGSALGRDGRVYVQSDGAETWVGGRVQDVITGHIVC